MRIKFYERDSNTRIVIRFNEHRNFQRKVRLCNYIDRGNGYYHLSSALSLKSLGHILAIGIALAVVIAYFWGV